MEPIRIVVIVFSGLIAGCFVGYICYNTCKDYQEKRRKDKDSENYGRSFIENNDYDNL